MKLNRLTTQLALTLGLLLCAVIAFAQDAPKPQLSRVSVTQVKPEMWEQFLALYKNETLPAQKKAGIKSSLVMQSSGPIGQGFEFRVVTPIDSLAQFDEGPAIAKAMGPEKWKAYQAKRRTMITGQYAYIIRTIPEAAIVPASTAKMLVRREYSVAPGRRAEFESYQKDLLPVLKKAGLKGHRVSRVMLGGDPDTYIHTDSHDSFAEYEKFVAAVNNMEEMRALSGRQAGVVTHRTVSVYTPILELSIQSAPAATANK